MAFQKGYVEVTLEVTAAPGCFLAANPLARTVARGDMAVFNITVSRLEGYAGPVYLDVVNMAGGYTITPNPVPAGETAAVLTVDTQGWTPNPGAPFALTVEGNDVPYPPDEEPV